MPAEQADAGEGGQPGRRAMRAPVDVACRPPDRGTRRAGAAPRPACRTPRGELVAPRWSATSARRSPSTVTPSAVCTTCDGQREADQRAGDRGDRADQRERHARAAGSPGRCAAAAGAAASVPGERQQQAGAAHEIEVERKEAADDRHEQHAAADAGQHRDDAEQERHREQRDGPDPPGRRASGVACVHCRGVDAGSISVCSMPKLAANLSLLFPDSAVPRPLRRRRERGLPLRRVPVPVPVRQRAAGRGAARAPRTSRSCCTTCPRATRRRAIAASPACPSARRSSAKAWTARSSMRKAAGCPRLNCLAGVAPAGVPREKLQQTLVENLRYAAGKLQGRRHHAAHRACQHAHRPGFLPQHAPPRHRGDRRRRRRQPQAAVRHLPHADHGRRPGEDHRAAAAAHRPHAARRRARTGTSRAPARSTSTTCCRTSTASATRAGWAANTSRRATRCRGWRGRSATCSQGGRRAPGRGGARAARVPARARRALAGRGHAALRVRRAHRLPQRADGGGAARDGRAGAAHPAHLPCARCAGGAARRRHRALGRRAAARRRRAAVDGEVHARAAPRPARAPRGRAAGRAQRGDLGRGGALRPVLRARPLEPDRLHHRRQRRREFRRRALPQVRPHGAQRAARARLRHGRRAGGFRRRGAGRRRAATCWRW